MQTAKPVSMAQKRPCTMCADTLPRLTATRSLHAGAHNDEPLSVRARYAGSNHDAHIAMHALRRIVWRFFKTGFIALQSYRRVTQ